MLLKEIKIFKISSMLIGIVIIGLIFLSTAIRFYPLTSLYSPHPADFGGPSYFPTKYAIENGNFLKNSLRTYTLIGGTIYANNAYPSLVGLYTTLTHVTGISIGTWTYNILLSIYLSIVFALAILLIYKYQLKDILRYKAILIIEISLLVLITLSGTPTIFNALLPTNAIFGWIYILLFLYLLLIPKINTRFVLMIFSIVLIVTYFTPSTILLIFIITWWLYTYFVENNYENKEIFLIVLFYVVLWTANTLFKAPFRFATVAEIGTYMSNLLTEGMHGVIIGVSQKSKILYPYITSTSLLNKLKHFVNLIFLAIPPTYYIFEGSRFVKKQQIKSLINSYIITLIVLGALFSAWRGIIGIWRLVEWGGLLSLIVIASLLPHLNKKQKMKLIFVITLTILSSSYVYITDENLPMNKIVYSEHIGMLWEMKTISHKDATFSDMRIAGAFVGMGYFKVYGLHEDKDNPEVVVRIYKQMYLNPTPQSVHYVLNYHYKEKITYVFFTTLFMKNVPGIRIYDYTLKPPKHNFIYVYQKYHYLSKIYTNDIVVIYRINRGHSQ